MEIVIEKKKNKRSREPHFEVNVEFMEGDADGSQTETLTFKEKETAELKRFVLALECCNAAYPNGRGGYDEYSGLPEYDAFFNQNGPELENYRHLGESDTSDEELEEMMEALMKDMNPTGISCDHPSDSNYISTSFDGYSVFFVNEEGDKQNVTFKFTAAEKKRIKECATHFND